MKSIKYMDSGRLSYITLHCAATPEGRNNSAAEVTKWDIDRFGQPSYHWVVELDGKAVRTLRDDQVGAHTGGHNTGNIGICTVGGTTSLNSGAKPKDTRTPAQKTTVRRLCIQYRVKNPSINILGHNEWPGVTKACPSYSVAAWLKAGMPV
jgi:N-acetylmuramoyl-L-alanine amidase